MTRGPFYAALFYTLIAYYKKSSCHFGSWHDVGVALTFLHFVAEHVDLCLACAGTLHDVQSVDLQLCSCSSFCSDVHRNNFNVARDDSHFIIWYSNTIWPYWWWKWLPGLSITLSGLHILPREFLMQQTVCNYWHVYTSVILALNDSLLLCHLQSPVHYYCTFVNAHNENIIKFNYHI